MKLKALAVDDEIKSGENLQILLEEFCDNVEVVGISQTVDDALVKISEHQPDVVFLDVRMNNETGFDLLNKCEKINFEVIFTTAYSEYAIKAFRFSAIDYLLKPIDIEDLQNAVKKAKEKITAGILPEERIESLLSNINPKTNLNSKIALPDSNGLTFVGLNEIIYCEGQSNYTIFFTVDGRKIMVSKTLKEYENLLSDHNFWRIHKSYLINMAEIKNYIKGDGGYVVMNNNKELQVSRRKKEEFLSKITSLQ